MRITIEVSDLMPAQQRWVAQNFTAEAVEPGQITACVSLNYGGEFGENVKHVEMAVTSFLLLLGEMVRVGRQAEALLTPDALPDEVLFEVAKPRARRTPAPLNDIYAAEAVASCEECKAVDSWPNS